MKKYEFTGETKRVGFLGNITLKRIRATVEFGIVKIGDLGGWIEKEENLSHEGKAWVYGDAEVWGNAKVYGDAEVWGNAKVCGDAEVWGNTEVWGNAKIWGSAKVWGNAKIWGHAEVCDDAKVYGNAKVCGDAKVYGNAKVCGDAEVFSASHVLIIGAIGSRNDFTTFYRDKDGEITVKCGCFIGKIDKFLEEVCETHGDSKYGLVYRTAVEIAKQQINLSEEMQ